MRSEHRRADADAAAADLLVATAQEALPLLLDGAVLANNSPRVTTTCEHDAREHKTFPPRLIIIISRGGKGFCSVRTSPAESRRMFGPLSMATTGRMSCAIALDLKARLMICFTA